MIRWTASGALWAPHLVEAAHLPCLMSPGSYLRPVHRKFKESLTIWVALVSLPIDLFS